MASPHREARARLRRVLTVAVVSALVALGLLVLSGRMPHTATSRVVLDIWGTQYVPAVSTSLAEGHKATVSIPFEVQIQTVEQLGRSRGLQQRVAARLVEEEKGPGHLPTLGRRLEVHQVGSSAVMEITATSGDPQLAVREANAAAFELAEWCTEMQMASLVARRKALEKWSRELVASTSDPDGEPSVPLARAREAALEEALRDLNTVQVAIAKLQERPPIRLVERAEGPDLPPRLLLLFRGLAALAASALAGLFLARLLWALDPSATAGDDG